ncbi:MAG: PAS domain S-box protein [Anaerolineaceae bacterium]|nr:PAS domain S-box protein [Anaerolineaceae bacterium]
MENSTQITNQRYRVLILDDDFELGELIREYLQVIRNCSVKYISTENDLWTCLKEETFDILFLDYKLPETNGLEILTRISANGYFIPTVMMTGEGNENIAVRAIQSGALDYLVKGDFSLTVLPSLIQKAVRQREIHTALQQYMDQIRFQALLLNNMRDAVVVWGLDGTITYWNVAAENLYGVSHTERVGKKVEEVFLPLFDPPLSIPAIAKSINFQLEHRFTHPKGDFIWISSQITTLYHQNSPGMPAGTMNVSRDISALKREQEKLEQSQNFIQRILDTSPNIIYILDLNSRTIRYINPEVKLILGYEIEDFLNQPIAWISTIIYPEDFTRMTQHIQDLADLKDGAVSEIEYRIFSKGREWRWLKSREAVFFREENGGIAEIIGLVQDITAEKQSEAALRKSEARYRAIVDDHQTEMICRFLPDMTLTFVNEAYCIYYAEDRGHLIGKNFLERVLETKRTAVLEQLTGLTVEKPVTLLEYQVQHSNGDTRWQEWVSRAIFDQSNKFVEFQAVGRDITDRKKMEETLKAAQTHLAQTARMASIGELASGVAHQISNPLTTIIADAQILTRDLEKDHSGHESAEAIMQAGWRAQAVINELMKFSQPSRADLEPVSVNQTIQAALLLTRAYIQASGINLTVVLPENLPQIIANPRQLSDLWVNLLLLARSAMKDRTGHQIQIETSLNEHGEVEICFTDDGIPIPPDQFERIFEPQLIPSNSSRGTGIELSICHEIVRQNNAKIFISNLGSETTFHIIFLPKGNS